MQKPNAGLEQHKAGNTSTAKSLYTESLSINPNSGAPIPSVTCKSRPPKKSFEAKHYLENLFAIAPNFTDTYSFLGNVLWDLKDYKTARGH